MELFFTPVLPLVQKLSAVKWNRLMQVCAVSQRKRRGLVGEERGGKRRGDGSRNPGRMQSPPPPPTHFHPSEWRKQPPPLHLRSLPSPSEVPIGNTKGGRRRGSEELRTGQGRGVGGGVG